MKVNITVDDELMKKIDEYADEHYMSRSGLMSLACSQYLQQYEMLSVIKSMGLAVEKLATEGADEDLLKELESYSRLCKMLTARV